MHDWARDWSGGKPDAGIACMAANKLICLSPWARSLPCEASVGLHEKTRERKNKF
jgi:hypothetical protein